MTLIYIQGFRVALAKCMVLYSYPSSHLPPPKKKESCEVLMKFLIMKLLKKKRTKRWDVKKKWNDWIWEIRGNLTYTSQWKQWKRNNRGFARRAKHPYAHVFAPPLAFLFVWCDIEKNNKKCFNFWFTSQKELKLQPSACANILVTQL